MKTPRKVIRVPKPAPGSYNPHRPISSLVKHQIFHLKHAESRLPKRHQTKIDVHSIETEGQASHYIHQVTKKLHPQGTKKSKQRPTMKTRRKGQRKADRKRKK